MRVDRLGGRVFDGHPAAVAVDDDDHVAFGLALHFQRIPAGELEQRAEVAADVAVDDDVRERGDA